jgi:hypothetical protein
VSQELEHKKAKDFGAEVRRLFRDGMARVYGRSIMRFLWNDHDGGHAQRQMAIAAGMTDQGQGNIHDNIYDGNVSFSALVALAVGLRFEFEDLPKKPGLSNIADSGMAHCLSSLNRETGLAIKDYQFETLRVLPRLQSWLRSKGMSDEKRRILVEKELPKFVRPETWHKLNTSSLISDLVQLERDWTKVWYPVWKEIRNNYRWTQTIKEYMKEP